MGEEGWNEARVRAEFQPPVWKDIGIYFSSNCSEVLSTASVQVIILSLVPEETRTALLRKQKNLNL